VVNLCQEARLVWGQELFFAATTVQANTALDSLGPRRFHEAKAPAAGLFADEATAASTRAAALTPPDDLPVEVIRLPTTPGSVGVPRRTSGRITRG
jgi:hypothetical protein